MTRYCPITGKRPLSGHNVSHANNKTKRRFLPNLRRVSFYSDSLGRSVQLRVSTSGIRTVERKGGIDAFLLGANDSLLDDKTLRLKRQVLRAVAKQESVPTVDRSTPASEAPAQG